MKSAIYEGSAYHQRLEPRRHGFRTRLFLMYLDLEEIDALSTRRWWWSTRRPNLVWFRRADYLGAAEQPLREAVLDRVAEKLGHRPEGPVRMLTHLRTFGYVFNPVTFYYCFDPEERLEAICAEITNTPWGERHTYVLDARREKDAEMRSWRFPKAFHVSPFFPLEQEYEWRFAPPGDELAVHMSNLEQGRAVFHAGLKLRRVEITGRTLAGALLRHPLLTFKVHAAIYVHAAILWLKRIPFHTHPQKRVALSPPPEIRS